ncbi:MAG: D-Ala-D-Ala carboxypeptidase family metallohydrolase [Pseudomonadales bacterium]
MPRPSRLPLSRDKLLLALLLLCCSSWASAQSLSIGIRGHVVQQKIFSLFTKPGEEMQLDVSSHEAGSLRLLRDGKVYGQRLEGQWVFNVPDLPGLYSLRLESLQNNRTMQLNLFVGQALSHDGDEKLNAYRIGPAPPGNKKHPANYSPPEVFFEVTADNIDTRLSEHFTLRQFLCKQKSAYPKYVVIQESLLVLLEGLLEAVVQAGYPAETFGIISGYRTPWYNKSIGNVPNSRHVYGDAMDFYVDVDGDGNMDDLNGDGQRNRADVELLFQIVENFKRQKRNALLIGGIGRYSKSSHHGGFVHVDARGYKARW